MGAERNSFCGSSQAGMSRTRSPAAINLAWRPLKNPASNNATALQTKKEKKEALERESE